MGNPNKKRERGTTYKTIINTRQSNYFTSLITGLINTDSWNNRGHFRAWRGVGAMT